jgi:hypothetical protein
MWEIIAVGVVTADVYCIAHQDWLLAVGISFKKNNFHVSCSSFSCTVD